MKVKMKLLSENLEEAISENGEGIVILINPASFHELASEKDIGNKLLLHDHSYHRFVGIPILIDRGVDTWEIKEQT